MSALNRLRLGAAKAALKLAPAHPSPDYLPLDRLTPESGTARAREEYEDEKRGGFLKLFDNPLQYAGDLVLDLGCGFGGRTVAFREFFGHPTVGLEIDRRVLDCAEAFARERNVEDVSFVVGFGEQLPFADASIDLILSYDVLEHVQDPRRCVEEALRVLRPGGAFLLVFPPFYHPTGAHLEGYVSHTPYTNVLFPPKVLTSAIDEILAERGNGFRPQPLAPGHRLYSLNGLTIRAFRRIVAESGFRVESLKCLPLFTKANRKYEAWKMKYYAWAFAWLSAVPALREMFTHRVVAVLRKSH